ncbi:hypothetical protein BH160DRAFT_3562 [Burkholderia sp. H160]|nr:hypothetical protein BH160DRAFT_3562 [Burkholderia sp. H160]
MHAGKHGRRKEYITGAMFSHAGTGSLVRAIERAPVRLSSRPHTGSANNVGTSPGRTTEFLPARFRGRRSAVMHEWLRPHGAIPSANLRSMGSGAPLLHHGQPSTTSDVARLADWRAFSGLLLCERLERCADSIERPCRNMWLAMGPQWIGRLNTNGSTRTGQRHDLRYTVPYHPVVCRQTLHPSGPGRFIRCKRGRRGTSAIADTLLR